MNSGLLREESVLHGDRFGLLQGALGSTPPVRPTPQTAVVD